MKDIVPLRNEAAYQEAIAEIRRLWGADPDSREGNHLDVLMVLVDDYENRNHAIALPDPIAAIRIRLAEMDLHRADLGRMLGIPSGRVSEILNRRRRLTIEMIRILAAELKLPESCLFQPYDLVPPSTGPQRRNRAKKPLKSTLAA